MGVALTARADTVDLRHVFILFYELLGVVHMVLM